MRLFAASGHRGWAREERWVTSVDPAVLTVRGIARTASLALCAFVPLGVLAVLLPDFLRGGFPPTDYPQFHQAAQAILHERDPYQVIVSSWGGPYPYPPLPAFAAAPFTLFSVQTAGLLVQGTLLVVALGAIFAAGVRDWRCYGIALLWPPVYSAIETGTPTLWIALAAALAWRYRDRVVAPAAAIGLALALKLFLWPLVVWLAATRRLRAAAFSLLVGMGFLVLCGLRSALRGWWSTQECFVRSTGRSAGRPIRPMRSDSTSAFQHRCREQYGLRSA